MQNSHHLPPSARAVYRAFLRNPAATPAMLAGLLDETEEAVTAELDLLGARGFVRRAGDCYEPVRPDAVVEDALRSEELALDQRRRELLDARRALSTDMDDYFAGREGADAPVVELETVYGLVEVRKRMDEIVGGVRAELLAVVTDDHDSADAVEAARDEDVALLSRGVAVRTIYPVTLREMPNTWAYAREMAAAGEVIRLSDDIPTRLIVRDRDLAVIPIDTGNLDLGVHIVRSHPIVSMFVALFELCWARATPVFAAPSAAAGERNRRLLDLLAHGAKDETIARHLGLNVRTVRRDIANLIAELGAETRFQAGVRAARRGWA